MHLHQKVEMVSATAKFCLLGVACVLLVGVVAARSNAKSVAFHEANRDKEGGRATASKEETAGCWRSDGFRPAL